MLLKESLGISEFVIISYIAERLMFLYKINQIYLFVRQGTASLKQMPGADENCSTISSFRSSYISESL